MIEKGAYSLEEVNVNAKEILSKISTSYNELLGLLFDEYCTDCPDIGDAVNDLGLTIQRVGEVIEGCSEKV